MPLKFILFFGKIYRDVDLTYLRYLKSLSVFTKMLKKLLKSNFKIRLYENNFYDYCDILAKPRIIAQTTAKVIKIKDGDTVVVLDSTNTQITLRLAEVDWPESSQSFGKNAKQFTADLIFGKEIVFFKQTTDRYGRIVAKVYLDKIYVSEAIIKAGMGWWYEEYSTDLNLKKLQAKAKRKKLGLWSEPKPIKPSKYRKTKK